MTDAEASAVFCKPMLTQYGKERLELWEYFSFDIEDHTLAAFPMFTLPGAMAVATGSGTRRGMIVRVGEDVRIKKYCAASAYFVDGRLRIDTLNIRHVPQVQNGMTALELRNMLGNPLMICGGWVYLRDVTEYPNTDSSSPFVRLPFEFNVDQAGNQTLKGWPPSPAARSD